MFTLIIWSISKERKMDVHMHFFSRTWIDGWSIYIVTRYVSSKKKLLLEKHSFSCSCIDCLWACFLFGRKETNLMYIATISWWNITNLCGRWYVRLSSAIQDLPRLIIYNVHGVNPKFPETGMKKRKIYNDACCCWSWKVLNFVNLLIFLCGWYWLM